MSSNLAMPYYKKAVQIEPSNSNALRELASMYYDLGQKEESIKVFNDAIQNEQDKIIKADLFFNLGVIHNQMENYEEAEKAFDEAYYLNEDDFEAALGMASAYEGLGDKYFNGTDGFDKNFDLAARWYRKAEKKIKDVKSIDFDNEAQYSRQLELIRYKRDIAEQN
jgi:tetratricopeptide (TPR) repeat protein